MGSYAVSLYPVLKAIKDMGEITPTNDKQTKFVEKYLAFGDLENVPELQVWVSLDAEELNQKLVGHGFQSRFSPFSSDQFGILSLLEIALQWLHAGESRVINAQNNRKYSGVHLDEADTSISVYRSWQHSHDVVSWRTKDDLTMVSVSFADRPLLGFALFDYVASIMVGRSIIGYSGVIFPCVSLHCTENMQWLVNMQVGYNRVAQATQENIIKMDEHGMEVKSATEMVMVAMSAVAVPVVPQAYIIDRPFYLWLSRVDCSFPLMVAYIDYNSWIGADKRDVE